MGKAKQMKKQLKTDEYNNNLLPSQGNEFFNCHNMSKKISSFRIKDSFEKPRHIRIKNAKIYNFIFFLSC